MEKTQQADKLIGDLARLQQLTEEATARQTTYMRENEALAIKQKKFVANLEATMRKRKERSALLREKMDQMHMYIQKIGSFAKVGRWDYVYLA